MAVFSVPVDNQEDLYQIITNLDNTTLGIKIRYNSRNDCWYMSIYDIDNVLLLDSIPLLSKIVQMVRPYGKLPLGTYGDFIVHDTSGKKQDCDRENFGNIIRMYYVNADEVE